MNRSTVIDTLQQQGGLMTTGEMKNRGGYEQLRRAIEDGTLRQIRNSAYVGIALIILLFTSCATTRLQQQVGNYVKDKQAQIGVAIAYDGKTICSIHAKRKFPMMSVFKLHQANAVLDSLDNDTTRLSESIWISKDMLRKDTYSPLREKYPQGNIHLPLAELLRYSLWLSDNNACDILFGRFGGTAYANNRMNPLKLHHTQIKWTEADMHEDTRRCLDNYTTPKEALLLLEKAYGNKWLRTCLSECKTGQSRIPALLPQNTIVGHKTGTGDKTSEGTYRGINDIGFIELPNGKHIFIAIFCDEAKMTIREAEAIIAEIARMAYIYHYHLGY